MPAERLARCEIEPAAKQHAVIGRYFMAYTRGFESDVFISYAHQDDTAGWVKEFHSQLKNRFGQLLGKAGPEVVIWRDPRLDPTNVVTPEILDQLSKTAVLLSIITPSCMESEWCIDERSKFQFFAALNGGLTIGNSARAVNVIKTPLRDEDPPDLLSSLILDFYARDEQAGRFSEYAPNDPQFAQRIDSLAQSLLAFFDKLNNRPVTKPKDAVFVALTPPDTRPTRDKIVQELEALEFVVLPPDGSISVERPGFAKAIDDCLSKSKLAVHFAGASAGVIPEGETLPLTALQFELATKHEMPRIVWLEPGTTTSAQFRAMLDTGDRHGTEILNNASQSVSDLKRLIVTTLGNVRQPPPPDDSKLNIYLLCDAPDYPTPATTTTPNLSKQIQEFLTQKGYTVWLPLIGAKNEQERTDDHEETLEMSDAVLVMWGETDEAWFRKRARELASVEVQRAYRPLRARALLLAAPPSNKDQYRGFLDMAIDLFGGFSPEKFEPLEQRLRPTAR
jgi:hypothetical protein